MSARYLKKLQQQTNQNIEPNDSDEDEQEDPIFKPKTVSLAALQFSDDESEESASETESTNCEEEEKKIESITEADGKKNSMNKKSKNKSGKAKKMNKKLEVNTTAEGASGEIIDDDELALLEFRKENNMELTDDEIATNSTLNKLLSLNVLKLNIDSELKRKFGRLNEHGGEKKKNPKQQGRTRGIINGSSSSAIKLQKSMFSHPKEDWQRPPSFVAGGIRIKKVNMEMSSETSQSSSNQGETIKDGGHAAEDQTLSPHNTGLQADSHSNSVSTSFNRFQPQSELYEFEHSLEFAQKNEEFKFYQSVGDIEGIVTFLAENPSHTETLVQLALICFKTNNKDVGLDLIKRCLYVYEMALNTDKSNTKNLINLCLLQLDHNRTANQPFFQSLFHFMKVSAMMGCESTAFEVSKLLLSLSPCEDPMSVLLHIDYFALFTKQYAQLHIIAELTLPILHADPSHQSRPTSSTLVGTKMVEIKDLPNLNFSNALACYLEEFENGDDSNSCSSFSTSQKKDDGRVNASSRLKDALQKYPCFLVPLLKALNIDTNAKSTRYDWNKLVTGVDSCFSPVRSSQGALLSHLAEIYALRCSSMWKRDDIINWLYETCVEVVTSASNDFKSKDTNTMVATIAAHFSRDYGVYKYLSVPLSEFSDQYEQLPPDMQVLDVNLLSPEKQRELAQMARQQHAGQRRYERALRQARQQQQHEDAFADSNVSRQGLGAAASLLDPSTPLLQMFWQSALPWNNVNFFPRGAGGGGGGGGREAMIDAYIRQRDDLQPPPP